MPVATCVLMSLHYNDEKNYENCENYDEMNYDDDNDKLLREKAPSASGHLCLNIVHRSPQLELRSIFYAFDDDEKLFAIR